MYKHPVHDKTITRISCDHDQACITESYASQICGHSPGERGERGTIVISLQVTVMKVITP